MFVRPRVRLFVIVALAAALFIEPGSALAKKKPKKKKRGMQLRIDPGEHFKPSMSFAQGTVGNYFFPDRKGASWTLRTTQIVLNDSGKVLRRDTVFGKQTVVDTARYSLQRLPLMLTLDEGYRPGSKDTVHSQSYFYIDDSVAMTVFNNSVTAQQNQTFLVSPLSIGNRWHDKYGDTLTTVIAGFVDSVVTPLGRFDTALVTLTQTPMTDLRKYFARGYGIVRTIYRSPGPQGRGLIIITTEMTECIRPENKQ
jgi:hypothetical protein